jgi:hypothetical protein
MCNIAAPILLVEGQNDANQSTPRYRIVTRESCLGPIENHSLRSSSPSSDSTLRMPHRASTTQEGIRETTKTVSEYGDVDTGRKSNTKVHLYLHNHLNHEKSHERGSAPAASLYSRWSSSARITVDRPPSQPLSSCQMSRGSSNVSVKEGHDEYRGERSDSKSLSRLGSTVGRLQDSDSRWSSSYRVALFDTAPSAPLARRRMIAEPSITSAVKESLKNPVEYLHLSVVPSLILPRAPPIHRQMFANFA